MRERIVFYDAKLITEQIGSGDSYDKVKKVVSIIITEEKLIPKSERYHHRFTMYDPVAGVELTDIIEIHTLELDKLPPVSDGSDLYDWASFIAASSEEELTVVAERNPQVGKAVMKFKELSADERTRDLYERREKARRDMDMRERWAIKKYALDTAKNLIDIGVSIENIMKATGLSHEEIENLLNEN
jgi:predicted transposase/invertase (TIGR01784 family)